jgi:glycosyltransferase involved in cell wall biosynthesis
MRGKIGLYILNFNNGRSLISAFYSAIAQLDYIDELLVIDNNSRELLSMKVLEEIENLGFKVLRRKTNSFIDACKEALDYFSTQYVLRLDSDDILCLGAMKRYKQELETNPSASMIVPSYITINSNGYPLQIIKKQGAHGLIPMFPPHGAVTLVDREKFLAAGGYISGFDRQDGFMVWLRMYPFKSSIVVLEESLFLYRLHGNNLSTDRNKLLKTRFKILEKLINRVPDFNLVFYNLPNEPIEAQVTKLNDLIAIANKAYVLSLESIEFPGVDYIKRPIDTMFSPDGLNNWLATKFGNCKKTILINSAYEGGIGPIYSALYYSEFTGFKGRFVLVDRINRTLFQNLDELPQTVSKSSIVSAKTTSFVKLSGFELVTSFNDSTFAVENHE